MKFRYELREWTDHTHADYVVKATSDVKEVLEAYLKRPSTPNDVWYRLHIVDTESTQV